VLGRLVRIVEDSDKVGLAAVAPVSAFGLGTAQVLDEPAVPVDETVRGFSPLSRGEAEWNLKPDASPAPFNLTGLVWWTVLAGLLLKPADGQERDLARTARLLGDDLRAMDAWFVPLECRGGRDR
jgi:hypothetical protein